MQKGSSQSHVKGMLGDVRGFCVALVIAEQARPTKRGLQGMFEVMIPRVHRLEEGETSLEHLDHVPKCLLSLGTIKPRPIDFPTKRNHCRAHRVGIAGVDLSRTVEGIHGGSSGNVTDWGKRLTGVEGNALIAAHSF